MTRDERNAAGDLARTTLAVLGLVALVAASLFVLRPFLPSLIWAATLVVATWPLLLRVQKRLWGSRRVAVVAMTLVLLALFATPFLAGIVTVADEAPRLAAWSRDVSGLEIPPPPAWLAGVPVVGGRLAPRWEAIAALERSELSERLQPYVRPAARWLVAQVGQLGLVFAHLVLTAALAAVLYARGEAAAAGVSAVARRLAGASGENAVLLAGKAVRSVALGVVGTAFAQSILAGIGLGLAGIPYAGVLTAAIFVLSVAQIGPLPVLLPAVAWLFWQGSATIATVLLVWTVLVGALDNVLRPLLIRRGADLPLLLIFAGVLGGVIGFGVVGLFIGPVLLAVTYTLLVDWVREPVPGAGPAARSREG